jgi:hypothetical protein
MKLGPKDSYVCLIPKALENIPSPLAEEQPDAELTPARSWALLEPLTGTCIYVSDSCSREGIISIVTSTGMDGLHIRIVIIVKFVNSRNLYRKPHVWQVSIILPQFITRFSYFFSSLYSVYVFNFSFFSLSPFTFLCHL